MTEAPEDSFAPAHAAPEHEPEHAPVPPLATGAAVLEPVPVSDFAPALDVEEDVEGAAALEGAAHLASPPATEDAIPDDPVADIDAGDPQDAAEPNSEPEVGTPLEAAHLASTSPLTDDARETARVAASFETNEERYAAAIAVLEGEDEIAGIEDAAPAAEDGDTADSPSNAEAVPADSSSAETAEAPAADSADLPRRTSPADTADLIEAAQAAARAHASDESETADAPGAPEDPDSTADLHEAAEGTSPSTTAEIDVEAVEAKIAEVGDPGSTQSFEPIPDEELIDTSSTFDAGTTTTLMWGARSDVGCVRSHNEDSYLVQSPLFAVCDGMGGHAAGEVASSIAVETIARCAPHAADPALLGAAVEAANAAVIEAATNGLGKPGMGCTATCAYIEKGTLAIAHVGDSRAYLLHEGSLIRITRDHSYVEELVDAGEITADEARVHPNRSVITRALGSDPAMYADHFQIGIETGDRLILCSDGLSSMIPDAEIERVARQSRTAQICTDNLVDAALAAGGGDNVSVVVVDLVDDGRLERGRAKRRRNVVLLAVALAALLVLGAAVTLSSIMGSVYLGVHGDVVAVYTGVRQDILGIKLHWLQDDTTVEVDDLPEDTQKRLREGIPQESLDAAQETVSKYRKQIYEEQTRIAQSADAVRGAAPGKMTTGGAA